MEKSLSPLFGVEVAVDNPHTVNPHIAPLYITQAALATPTSTKVVLSARISGNLFQIGTLCPWNGVYHMPLDMRFMPHSEVELSLEGDKNARVHLTGYYELDENARRSSENLGTEGQKDEMQESAVGAKPEPTTEKAQAKAKVEEVSSSDSDESGVENQEETSEEKREESQSHDAVSDEAGHEDVESVDGNGKEGTWGRFMTISFRQLLMQLSLAMLIQTMISSYGYN